MRIRLGNYPQKIRQSCCCVAVILTGVLFSMTGCSEGARPLPLATVSGMITLDKQPLPNAIINFVPETGPASGALTDEHGTYYLTFKNGKPGAIIGTHTVSISTDLQGTSDPSKQKVPARYNTRSTLTVLVDEGDNNLFFDLVSQEKAD